MLLYDFDKKKYERTLREEGRDEGRESGLIEGSIVEKINLIIKKVSKSKTLEQIVEEMESTVEEITPIYNLVVDNRELSAEQIYELYLKNY